jgi:hypothetical protein
MLRVVADLRSTGEPRHDLPSPRCDPEESEQIESTKHDHERMKPHPDPALYEHS